MTVDARIDRWRRRLVRVAAVGMLSLLGWAPSGLPAGAASVFSGVASAEGVRVTFQANGGPATNTPVDGGSPVAQAALDSLGSSTAFASHLYPGDAAVAGPGTIAGVSNGQVNLPEYPLIAHSDAATKPESNVSGGGASLRAASSADRSEASATVGFFDSPSVTVASAATRAVVLQSAAGPRAVSTSEIEGFVAGPLVLARVHSVADVVAAGDGTVARRSELRISGANIAGNAVEIGPQGVTFGPSVSPLPGRPPIDEVLRQAGITLRYLAPEDVDGGVVSASLVVTIKQAVPGPVTPVGAQYLLGRTSARMRADGSDLPPIARDGAVETPAAPTTRDTAVTGEVTEPPIVSSTEAGPAFALSPAPVAPVDVPAVISLPTPRAGPQSAGGSAAIPTDREPERQVALARGVALGLFNTRKVYLVIAVGGLLAGAAVRIISQVGR